MLSKAKNGETILPIRCTIEFSKMCRHRSAINYPLSKNKNGAKKSFARFLKMAAIEKLERVGLNKEYLKSLL
jgi:hypothetical protein